MGTRLVILAVVVAALVGWLSGCAQEEYPMALWNAEHPDGGAREAGPEEASAEVDAASNGPLTCRQSRSQSMPSLLEAIGAGASDSGAEAAVSGTAYTPALLFQRFTATCGACHGVVQGLGGFRIQTVDQFENNDWSTTLPHILSNGPSDPKKPQDPNDPNDPMPPFPPMSPTGKPYSQRAPGDLVRQLAELLQQWLMLGKPPSFFVADANHRRPSRAFPSPRTSSRTT